MVTVMDVAHHILGKEIPGMTSMKLQRLVFYSQAYSLAWTGTPLFDDDIFAWENGPIVRTLFEHHRGIHLITVNDLKEGHSKHLNDAQKIIIDSIVDQLGKLSADQLRERVRRENPWLDARKQGSYDISHETLREYYSKY